MVQSMRKWQRTVGLNKLQVGEILKSQTSFYLWMPAWVESADVRDAKKWKTGVADAWLGLSNP